MIAVERETCALGVRAENHQGVLFFVAGELYDAVLDDLRGEEAAIQILGWDLADIATQVIAEPPPRSIDSPLTFILLEAMRRRDEGISGAEGAEPAHRETLITALLRDLDGVTSGCLVDLTTGLPLEEHFSTGATLDKAQVSRSGHELARTELALIAALGLGSTPEEIVLSFTDLLFYLRFLRPGLLLILTADPARTGIPGIHAALHRLVPVYAEKLPSWLD
jgi:hypothetical protein